MNTETRINHLFLVEKIHLQKICIKEKITIYQLDNLCFYVKILAFDGVTLKEAIVIFFPYAQKYIKFNDKH